MDGSVPETITALQHALVMAALADGRSTFAHAEPDEQTQLLVNGLLGLGVAVIVDPVTRRIDVAGSGGYWPNSDAEIDGGDSFPLTCLLIAACSVGRGQYTVRCVAPAEGDKPLIPLLSALVDLRASIDHGFANGRLWVNIGPESIKGGTTRLPMGCSPVVLESLLVVAPYAITDVMVEARGSTSHATEHLLPLMDRFGVSVVEESGRFVVAAPQRYRGREVPQETL